METSSPLAALRATSVMPLWAGNDLYNSHSQATAHYSTSLFGSSALNFRELGMNRSNNSDCFRSSIIRGSSPTASLAADLSQNFHIDMRRKKYVLARQGFTRGKSCLNHLMPNRKPDNPVPLFRFEAGSSKLSTTSSMSLGECFMESPPHERRPQSATCSTSSTSPPPPPRLGKAFASSNSNSNSRLTGSPMANYVKRPSNPLVRPRKLFRRSLSMFENREEMIGSQRDDCVVSNLHTVMDIDELHQPTLPHFFQEGSPDSIPRVTQQTFLEVLDGKFATTFDNIMIIDCRFEYEFEGGHIDGAVNFNDKELLATHLFGLNSSRKTLLIFHCEYSAHRAPIMARHIRKQDRAVNIEQYPMLTFPEVYILEGGYNAFYARNRERCFPQNYVEMGDKDHAFTCEREMGRLRQNRSKFSRAQTFAFGDSSIDDSPTAPPRCRNINRVNLDIGVSSPISCGRRLVTY